MIGFQRIVAMSMGAAMAAFLAAGALQKHATGVAVVIIALFAAYLAFNIVAFARLRRRGF